MLKMNEEVAKSANGSWLYLQYFQSEFNCCGVETYKDYFQSNFNKSKHLDIKHTDMGDVPLTCCSRTHQDNCANEVINEPEKRIVGCIPKLSELMGPIFIAVFCCSGLMFTNAILNCFVGFRMRARHRNVIEMLYQLF